MAKPKKPRVAQEPNLQNPVAKYMHRFNKAQTYDDKTHYKRNRKHKNAEPFPIGVSLLSETAPVRILKFSVLRSLFAASALF